jgi:CRP-like cAMP-binding protein
MGGELEKGQGVRTTPKLGRSIQIHLNVRKTIDALSQRKTLEIKDDKAKDRLSYKPPEKKNKIDADLISSSIDKNCFLRNLRNNEKNEIIMNMSLFHMKPHSAVYLLGAKASYWYVIRKGDLELYVDNKKIKTLKQGDSFGDVALINNCGQNGTIKVITDCELWGLKREDFEKIKDKIIKVNSKENSDYLKSLQIPIKDAIKRDMANFLIKNIYKPNEVICQAGEILSCIYFIKEGEVTFMKNNVVSKRFKRKEFFGEDGLFEGYRNTADIIAKTNCIIYTISYEFFYGYFGKGKKFKDQFYFTLLKCIFSKSSTLNMIGTHLNENFENFKFKVFKANNTVYKKGTNLSKLLCVVLTGNILENKKIKFTKNDILFEKELLKDRQIILQYDLTCDSNCVIAEANFEEVNNDLEDNFDNQNLNSIDNSSITHGRLKSETNLYPKQNVYFSSKNTIDSQRSSFNPIITRNRNSTINNNIINNNSNSNYKTISNVVSATREKKNNFFSNTSTLNSSKRETRINPFSYSFTINTDRRDKKNKIISAFTINTEKRGQNDSTINIKKDKKPIYIKREIKEIKERPKMVINKDKLKKPIISINLDKIENKNVTSIKNDNSYIGTKGKSIISITKEKPNNKIYNSVIGFNNNSKEANFKYTKTIADNNNQKKKDKIKMISIEKISNINKNNESTLGRAFTTVQDKKINTSPNLNDIEKIKVFKKLDLPKKQMLQKCLGIEKFNGGQNILVQGNNNDKLYIIKSGRVELYLDSKYIKSKDEGEVFGFDSLITSNTKCLETITAKGKVECYTLDRDNFNKILNKDLKDYFLNQYYLNDYSVELEDLEYVKMLGEGSYGFVNLVCNKKNKHLYAAKALYLMQIKEENILARTECERDLLLKMDHPFIAKCVKCLKHDVYLLYIMEYVQGKELFDIMREINLFSKEQTQFYGASMLEVINYLHKKKIIYRDLKPENIMMKENGYIKFIDFGTVKEIRDKTKTFIGTYSYMAPEVFIGQGYSFQVDMWSLAIIMYEFLCGKLPFGEDFDEEEDTMKFYDVLKKEKLAFPSFIQDEDFKNLIQKMLVMDPNKRLNQYSKIRAHPFFKGFDWDKLDSCELRAPYNFNCTKKINMNNTKSYLEYLTSLSSKPYYKKLASLRQLKFQKWYDNF